MNVSLKAPDDPAPAIEADERFPGLLPAAGPGCVEWAIARLFGASGADAVVLIDNGTLQRIGRYFKTILNTSPARGHFVSPTTAEGGLFVAIGDPSDREWLDVCAGIVPTLVIETSPKTFEFIYGFEEPVPAAEFEKLANRLRMPAFARLPSGRQGDFRVRLIEASGARCSAAELALAFGVRLTPRPGPREPRRQTRLTPISETPPLGCAPRKRRLVAFNRP